MGTLEYFMMHWSIIAGIANTILKPKDVVYRCMEGTSIERAAMDQLAVLAPAIEALNKVQSDNSLLRDVYENWNELGASVSDEYQSNIAPRRKCLSGIHFAADLLNPRFRCREVCSAEVHSAVAYFQEDNQEVGSELTKFIAAHHPIQGICIRTYYRIC